MRRSVLLLSVLVAVLPLGSAGAAGAPPPDSSAPINFSILPGTQPPPGHPIKQYFSYTLTPGQVLHDTAMVVNPSKTASLRVRLTVSDAVTAPQGGGLAFTAGPAQRQIGRWLHLSVDTLTVGPYQVAYVPLTLNVPSAVRPGDYLGAVTATNAQPARLSAGKIGIRMYLSKRCIVVLRVAGRAVAGLHIARVGVTVQRPHTVLAFVLQNTGTVVDYPVATTVTFQGRRTYVLRPLIGLVLGGGSAAVGVALERTVLPGSYRVRIQIPYLARTVAAAPLQHLQTVWGGTLVVPPGAGL